MKIDKFVQQWRGGTLTRISKLSGSFDHFSNDFPQAQIVSSGCMSIPRGIDNLRSMLQSYCPLSYGQFFLSFNLRLLIVPLVSSNSPCFITFIHFLSSSIHIVSVKQFFLWHVICIHMICELYFACITRLKTKMYTSIVI